LKNLRKEKLISLSKVESKINKPFLGISLILCAFLFFSFIAASAKWLVIIGFPTIQLVFMRYLGHFIISFLIIILRNEKRNLYNNKDLKLIIFRAFLLFGSTAFAFSAFVYLPISLTATIEFTAPIIICFLSWPILGEKVGIWRSGAIILGFIGIIIIIKPYDESFHPAVFLSLSGAFCFALYAILSRMLAGFVLVDVMQFYSGLIGSLITLPFAIVFWEHPNTLFDWLIMLMMGICGWSGHQLFTKAHNFAPANLLIPFGYSFILYNTIWSYFLSGYIPDYITILGGMVIILSGLIIWFRELKISK